MESIAVAAEKDILLTADDVVERLLDSPRLREAASNCVLPAIRVGSGWRFRKRDLDEWIARQLAPAN